MNNALSLYDEFNKVTKNILSTQTIKLMVVSKGSKK